MFMKLLDLESLKTIELGETSALVKLIDSDIFATHYSANFSSVDWMSLDTIKAAIITVQVRRLMLL